MAAKLTALKVAIWFGSRVRKLARAWFITMCSFSAAPGVMAQKAIDDREGCESCTIEVRTVAVLGTGNGKGTFMR